MGRGYQPILATQWPVSNPFVIPQHTPSMSTTFESVNTLVGSPFVALTEHGPVELVLVEATERARGHLPEQFRTPFTLLFHGPEVPRLSQATYTLSHPQLGSVQWMLVPSMPDTRSPNIARYEALFG